MRHWVRPRSRRDELGMRNERCAELVLVRASEDSALAPPLAALARRQVARAVRSRRQRRNDPRSRRPCGWVMTSGDAYPAGSDRDRAVRAPSHPRRSCRVLHTDALPLCFNLGLFVASMAMLGRVHWSHRRLCRCPCRCLCRRRPRASRAFRSRPRRHSHLWIHPCPRESVPSPEDAELRPLPVCTLVHRLGESVLHWTGGLC